MAELLNFHFDVDGEDFTCAGQASVQVKKNLRRLGLPPEIIRRVSIAMYEGEINMVIHAGGGTVDVNVSEDYIEIILSDTGPGIADIEQAMEPMFTTKPELERSGMGFTFMSAFMDDVQVQSEIMKGTTVTLYKRLCRLEEHMYEEG